jgi:hypothetical protein
MEGGDDPSLKRSGAVIESEGVPDITSMTENAANGFTVEGPDLPLTVIPTGASGATPAVVTEGIAAVSANAASGVDAVVRPQYNGAMVFSQIRDPSSPEEFSWEVKLGTGQHLSLLDSAHAEVVYENGARAFLITAELAHDATGAAVETSFNVEGKVLTLDVHHRIGGIVYPVIAGQAYETSYETGIVPMPPSEQELEEEAQGEEDSNWQAPNPPLTASQAERIIRARMRPYGTVPAPGVGAGEEGASASRTRTFTVEENHTCQIDHCAIYRLYLRNPSFIRGYNWVKWEPGTQVHCGWSQSPFYYLNPIVEEEGCSFTGPSKPYKGENKHLTIYGRWAISAVIAVPVYQEVKTNYIALQTWVWPNGFQERIIRHYDPGIVED